MLAKLINHLIYLISLYTFFYVIKSLYAADKKKPCLEKRGVLIKYVTIKPYPLLLKQPNGDLVLKGIEIFF